jgi:sigma-E factor negative regulatory protein RseA
MSREALQESLSAVMDNEADELELRRVLSAVESSEARATWARYQIARAAMHKELLEPRLDLAAAVSVALADETAPVRSAARSWGSLGRLAVAASVTVAVLAGVRLYNQNEMSGNELAQQAPQPVLTAPQAQGPAVLAGYTESNDVQAPAAKNQADWQDEQILRQQPQESASKGAHSSMENR